MMCLLQFDESIPTDLEPWDLQAPSLEQPPGPGHCGHRKSFLSFHLTPNKWMKCFSLMTDLSVVFRSSQHRGHAHTIKIWQTAAWSSSSWFYFDLQKNDILTCISTVCPPLTLFFAYFFFFCFLFQSFFISCSFAFLFLLSSSSSKDGSDEETESVSHAIY